MTKKNSTTDKGRQRPAGPPPPPPDEATDAAVGDGTPSKDDYRRTTGRSPAATAVIPAVKDVDESDDSANKSGQNGVVKTTTGARFEPVDPDATERPAGRDARLRLTHVDPWSVTRMAFVVSVAMMIVIVVATVIFWIVLNMLGVWDQISDSVTSVLSDSDDAFDITDYLGLGRLVGLALLLSVLNVVVWTVLATIGAHLYNLASQVLGGLQMTFSNDK